MLKIDKEIHAMDSIVKQVSMALNSMTEIMQDVEVLMKKSAFIEEECAAEDHARNGNKEMLHRGRKDACRDILELFIKANIGISND